MRAFFLLLPLLLAACAATAPSQSYRSEGGETLTIQGSLNKLSGDLVVTINGEPVVHGKFPTFAEEAEFEGSYRDATVTVSCYVDHCTHGTKCTVLVDNEQAAKLMFK
ncbi:MAG: hypothetical protein D6819_05540 [Gammaproteobacteria bacterium]|nr:MAG: hypothetical protein D6819_05540 [Gammaproteobacteria bacterium]